MTDRELLELIATKVSSMDMKILDIDKKISDMDKKISDIDHRTIIIENQHGEKLSALFDGYKQHTEQLERIEKAVIDHDEILFKRVK